MTDILPSDERDQFAAEFALGVLDADDRARAYRLISSDPHFAAEVTSWQERLAPLLGEIVPVDPGPALWERINRALDASGEREENVVDIQRALRRWKGVAAAMTAVAAALLVMLALPRPAPLAPAPGAVERTPAMTASITADGGAKSFLITWSPTTRKLVVLPAAVAPVPGHSHQLWLISAGGKPISLGVIDAARPMQMPLTPSLAARLVGSSTLAVSAEPQGGSPTGQPTGPVIGSGALRPV